MASQQETVDYICEQLAGAGSIVSRKMFGEYGVYCDGKFIGVICNNTLFLKVTKPAREAAPQIALAPAYEGAKPSFQIPAEMLEDAERLAAFARVVHDSLPAKKK
ncbi:MAG: competence protein TfoX [Rhodobacterales bacterium]|nr:MAG: competence protein TfoX [Rhodobacterales bacterium]